MALFNYKARNKLGQEILGSIEALEESIVIKSLRKLGYSIVSIQKASTLKLKIEGLLAKFRKVRQQELLMFVRQFSTLLKSGVPLTIAVENIRQQTENPVMLEMLEKVKADIESGVSLSESLKKHPRIFSDFFVSMVGVGEAGGILEDVLDRLTQLLTQEIEIRGRIKSAMIYPVVLVVVAAVIITYILAAIIPKFVTIFDSYGAKLPLATRILLLLSLTIQRFWFLLPLGAIAFALWMRRYLKSEKGRLKIDSLLFSVPLFGQLYVKIIIAQFSRTLASLLRSGVTLMEALRVTEKTVTNATLRRSIHGISAGISKGEPLSDLFAKTALFPVMVVQMISVGERTGKLESILFDVANFFDQEIDYAIRNLTAVLEPVLLLAMGSMVAFIALSVLLPIFNIIKVFRH